MLRTRASGVELTPALMNRIAVEAMAPLGGLAQFSLSNAYLTLGSLAFGAGGALLMDYPESPEAAAHRSPQTDRPLSFYFDPADLTPPTLRALAEAGEPEGDHKHMIVVSAPLQAQGVDCPDWEVLSMSALETVFEGVHVGWEMFWGRQKDKPWPSTTTDRPNMAPMPSHQPLEPQTVRAIVRAGAGPLGAGANPEALSPHLWLAMLSSLALVTGMAGAHMSQSVLKGEDILKMLQARASLLTADGLRQGRARGFRVAEPVS